VVRGVGENPTRTALLEQAVRPRGGVALGAADESGTCLRLSPDPVSPVLSSGLATWRYRGGWELPSSTCPADYGFDVWPTHRASYCLGDDPQPRLELALAATASGCEHPRAAPSSTAAPSRGDCGSRRGTRPTARSRLDASAPPGRAAASSALSGAIGRCSRSATTKRAHFGVLAMVAPIVRTGSEAVVGENGCSATGDSPVRLRVDRDRVARQTTSATPERWRGRCPGPADERRGPRDEHAIDKLERVRVPWSAGCGRRVGDLKRGKAPVRCRRPRRVLPGETDRAPAASRIWPAASSRWMRRIARCRALLMVGREGALSP